MTGITDAAGVVGAGLMGTEIALVHALAGRRVLLNDASTEALGRAMERLESILERGVARGSYTVEQRDDAIARLQPAPDVEAFAEVSIVTEAVFEDEAVKKAVLARLDQVCPAGAIIATNTSTIPIATLAAAVAEARRPRFVGTHYFSPVSRMQLVEVIPGFETSDETLEAAMAFCKAAGKVPIRVKDVPGFAVNRMLHVFMIEAVRLVEEGVCSPEDIDTACKLSLGHPMGPFDLMDAVTSSLSLQAQEIMFDACGERFRPRPLMKQRVAANLPLHSPRVRIGMAMRAFGLTARALRYYESMGLVETLRDRFNTRYYDQVARDRLEWISRLRRVDLSLVDIREVLSADQSEERVSRARSKLKVRHAETIAKAAAIEEEIAELSGSLSA